jgi:hypothetical protein
MIIKNIMRNSIVDFQRDMFRHIDRIIVQDSYRLYSLFGILDSRENPM